MGFWRKITYVGLALNLLGVLVDMLGGGSPVQDAIEVAVLARVMDGAAPTDGKPATAPEAPERELRDIIAALGR